MGAITLWLLFTTTPATAQDDSCPTAAAHARVTSCEGAAPAPDAASLEAALAADGAIHPTAAPSSASAAPRVPTDRAQSISATLRAHLCAHPNGTDGDALQYRLARLAYEANRWEEAAVRFREVALGHPDSDLADLAASSYLDALNQLGTHRARPGCHRAIDLALGPLDELFCGARRSQHDDLCELLERVGCAAARREASRLEAAGDRSAAAARLIRIADERRCDRLDEALANAATLYTADGRIGSASLVRRRLIEQLPGSELAREAMFSIGASHHAVLDLAEAATWYERFARRYPGEDGRSCPDVRHRTAPCPRAPEALRDAVYFRLAAGDLDRASVDVQLFERNYGRRLDRMAAGLSFALAEATLAAGSWRAAEDRLRAFLHTYGGTATPGELLRARVALGRAHHERRALREARRAWESALSDAEPILTLLRASVQGEVERDRHIAEVGSAVAEARFRLADVAWPGLRQAPGRGAPRRRWVEQTEDALSRAQGALQGVDGSPRWIVASLCRLGELHLEAAAALGGAADDDVARSLEARARGRFERCLSVVARHRTYTSEARSCAEHLSRLAPDELAPMVELTGSPVVSAAAPARPVLRDPFAEPSHEP